MKEGAVPPPTAVWVFGNPPLPQTLTLAPILRRLTGAALSLEHEEEGLAQLIEYLVAAEEDLGRHTPADPSPRIGPEEGADRRVYLDHGRSIGSFNPCFPEYEIRVAGRGPQGPCRSRSPTRVLRATSTEGFWPSSSTASSNTTTVNTAWPARPLRSMWSIAVLSLSSRHCHSRSSALRTTKRITSAASIELDGVVLCQATMEAVAGDRSRLPEVSPRRGPR